MLAEHIQVCGVSKASKASGWRYRSRYVPDSLPNVSYHRVIPITLLL